MYYKIVHFFGYCIINCHMMHVNEYYKIYVGCFCVRTESVIGHQVLERASLYIQRT